MAKTRTIYVCQECGHKLPRWEGKCSECNKWNSIVEELEVPVHKAAMMPLAKEAPMSITQVSMEKEERLKTKISEFDRILGGGIVSGSVILVGGEPGIGKSTLLLQVSNALSQGGDNVLYVSGEESTRQTKLRADRLGANSKDLYLVNETNLDTILEYMDKSSPRVAVIDSIQVLYRSDIASSPGSVSQVRECAAQLTSFAKAKGTSIFLVGHVTKDGSIAGPRVLEHIVDTVLYFEGERHHNYRILRAVKNRFGSTNEIGIFEMSSSGLIEVENPSELFLMERPLDVSGSVVVPCIEGTRPILVELQALVSPTNFGLPRRRTTGLDYNRVALILAVLEKRVGLGLAAQDVFVNVAGGLKITEPSTDLGVAVAVYSSLKEIPAKRNEVVLGEIGLAGEVRGVTQVQNRILEAERIGFKRCILSKTNLKGLKSKGDMEIIGIETVKEAIEAAI